MANAPKTKEKELYFKLNQTRSAYWGSDDGSITLSIAQAANDGLGVLYAAVPIDEQDYTYKQVMKGIDVGILMNVKKAEYESNKSIKDKLPMVDLTGKAEKDGVMKRKVDSVMRLKDEDAILTYIKEQKDPDVLSHMMQVETTGDKREKIMRELDTALREAGEGGMSEVIAEGGTQKYEFTNDGGHINKK